MSDNLMYTGPRCTECSSPMLWLDCSVCGGSGDVPSPDEIRLGTQVMTNEMCDACDGTGHDWFCPECEPDKVVDWIPF